MIEMQNIQPHNNSSRLKYHGQLEQLYGIWIINLLLGICTLGVYGFWGVTRNRRYLANNLSLLNDKFEYTGTGLELFLGFLKAIPFIVILYAPFFIWDPNEYPLVLLIIIVLIPLPYAAYYAALRYRLSRLTWRGIRFYLSGSAFIYARIVLIRMFIDIFTLGILAPYSDMKTYGYIFNNCHFGNKKLEFNGRGKELMKINIITLLLIIPTLGFSRFWYAAALAKHICENTHIDNLRFRSHYKGRDLFKLLIVNFLILIFTLGFGTPIIIHRSLLYFTNRLELIGDVEATTIMQSEFEQDRSGEGFEAVFEL